MNLFSAMGNVGCDDLRYFVAELMVILTGIAVRLFWGLETAPSHPGGKPGLLKNMEIQIPQTGGSFPG